MKHEKVGPYDEKLEDQEQPIKWDEESSCWKRGCYKDDELEKQLFKQS